MSGVQLRFYTYENRRIHGEPAYEWLLAHARRLGAEGGSAFRAIAGYGRHGRLHEQRFFELAGDVPVVVEFLVEDTVCAALLRSLAREGLSLLYSRSPIEFGDLSAMGGEPGATN